MEKLTQKQIYTIAQDLDAGMLVYLNTKTGETIALPDFENNIHADRDIWDSTLETIEEQSDDLFLFELMSSFQAFKVMEGFANQVEDSTVKERLLYALNKNKPFKNFKYEIEYHESIREQWFLYKQLQFENWVVEQWEDFINDNATSNEWNNDEEGETSHSASHSKETNNLTNYRQLVSSGAKWEDIVGYSRAVRVGNIIEVAGTTAVDETGTIIGIDDIAAQTTFILHKIERALQEAGASLKDVVRTRIYVTDINQWEAVGKAHGSFFSTIKPASTMVQVSGLVDLNMLVEIEVTAIL